jgi:alkylresorcinol/alkylpyrone synthase
VFGSKQPRFWAVHPGGRAIVDKLEEIFQLPTEALVSTREVLRQYGNMSSATILFVLEHLQQQLRTTSSAHGRTNGHVRGPLSGVAMAFGPGLVVETSRLTYVPPLPPLAVAEQMAHRHTLEPVRDGAA